MKKLLLLPIFYFIFIGNVMACNSNNVCKLEAHQTMDMYYSTFVFFGDQLNFSGSFAISHEGKDLPSTGYNCRWTGTDCSDSTSKSYSQWWLVSGTKSVTLSYNYVCSHKKPISSPSGGFLKTGTL